jgi:serine protease Do
MNSSIKTLALVGILSSATTLGAYKLFFDKPSNDSVFTSTPSAFTRMVSDNTPIPSGVPGDFTYAAEKTTPAVVHIGKQKVKAEIHLKIFLALVILSVEVAEVVVVGNQRHKRLRVLV